MKKTRIFPRKDRLLALLLAFSMLAAILSRGWLPRAAAASMIPTISAANTVIVAGDGASYIQNNAVVKTSFVDALSYLSTNAPYGNSLIVIAGKVTQDTSIVTEYAHTGTIYITGESAAYGVSGGILYFSRAGNTNNDFGGPTVFENIVLERNSAATGFMRLYANTSLVFGSGVTVANESEQDIQLCCGSYYGYIDSYLEMKSGSVDSIRACGVRYRTGNSRIVIDGDAVIKSFIAAGSFSTSDGKETGDVTITVNGGMVNAIYATPLADGLVTKSVTVNFNGGKCTKGIIAWTGSAGAGSITNNYVVNLSKDFVPGSNFKLQIPNSITGVSYLNLKDINGELDSNIDVSAFDNIVVETGEVVYTGTALTNQNIAAYTGASLCIPNIAQKPAGVTYSGAVHFGKNVSHTHKLSAVAANAATCTKAGNLAYWHCEDCDQYYKDAEASSAYEADGWILPAHGLTHVERKEATKTADGNIEYWYCTACEKYYADGAAVNEIQKADTVIPAASADSALLGDADGDNYVDAYDASLVVKYSIGLVAEGTLDLSVLDLDGDGYVDAFDAALIQKYSVGAINKFPVADGQVMGEEPAKVLNAADDTIKILSIGNSFSRDSMEYLYQIAQSTGVKVELAILYKGGSKLSQHIANGLNTVDYTYYTNTNGTWQTAKNYKIADALGLDWDYIMIQESSKNCGEITHYATDLPAMIELVRSMNMQAKLIWNMTWAYQQNTDHANFPDYGNNQLQMYNMIMDCLQNAIMPEYDFDVVIPCMTAVQNARTSFLGDTITRDGYHMNMNLGRYIACLTMFSAITGISPDQVSYNPDANYIDAKMLQVAKESVKNAIAQPYSITKSAYAGTSDKEVAAVYGVDLDDYIQVNWDYKTNSYWNCGSGTNISTPSSGSNYNMFICTDRMWTVDQLPEGTIFIMDHNWQTRLQIWSDPETAYSGSHRPAKIGMPVIKLSDYLDGCSYIAWNVTCLDYRYADDEQTNKPLFDEAFTHFRVYIPING